ncbi:MAG: hypothetical protein JOY85_22175 [Acidobacteriaceae bacterium]|nr:hypothetical protein [Acidobacteriaceae bacterium]
MLLRGGSIPIVGEFAKHLGIPTALMGFGLPDDGLHSPNEKLRLIRIRYQPTTGVN